MWGSSACSCSPQVKVLLCRERNQPQKSQLQPWQGAGIGSICSFSTPVGAARVEAGLTHPQHLSAAAFRGFSSPDSECTARSGSTSVTRAAWPHCSGAFTSEGRKWFEGWFFQRTMATLNRGSCAVQEHSESGLFARKMSSLKDKCWFLSMTDQPRASLLGKQNQPLPRFDLFWDVD